MCELSWGGFDLFWMTKFAGEIVQGWDSDAVGVKEKISRSTCLGGRPPTVFVHSGRGAVRYAPDWEEGDVSEDQFKSKIVVK